MSKRRPGLMARLNAAFRLAFGFYEGARWDNARRTWLWGGVQAAEKDITKHTRKELIRRARYFEKNNWLFNALALTFEQYVVGPHGLSITPSTENADFNAAAAEFWADTQEMLDIESLQGSDHLDGKTCWRWFTDGEAYWLKTRGDSGFARLQLIEAHSIENPEGVENSDTLKDGVIVDPTTYRPRGYVINGKPVDARFVIPILERTRARQSRSLPFITPVINKLHDLDDLDELQMRNSKAAVAHNALFVENESGESDEVEAALRHGDELVTGDSIAGELDIDRTKYYQEATGGRILYGKTGEKIHSIGNNSPSASDQWFHDSNIVKVCSAVGIAAQIVFPRSIQGTVERAELDRQAQRFASWSSIMGRAKLEAYRYCLADARSNPKALTKYFKGVSWPDDFRKASYKPPRGINVDVGRNSNAAMQELRAGGRTFQGWWGELGQDWREALTQKADEIEFIYKLAQDRGVDPKLISDIVIQTSMESKREPQLTT